MNTTLRLLAASVSFAAAGAAFAEGPIAYGEQANHSQATRAAVVAQVLQASYDGTLFVTEADLQKIDGNVAARSRADVRSETLAAAARGELNAAGAEIRGVQFAAAPASTLQMAGIAK